MFLELTKRRNPKLIEAAKFLHQSGKILPDTYLLDLDIIAANTKQLASEARRSGITLYYMTKQVGRNPLVSETIRAAGIDKAVVVDHKEARVMLDFGFPIGNIGHLSQVPKAFLETVLLAHPDFITVFSLEALTETERLCKKHNLRQSVLLRVYDKSDMFYEGQRGGFSMEQLHKLSQTPLDAIQVAGVTSFPCFLVSDSGGLMPTENVKTLASAKKILIDGLSKTNLPLDFYINMPSVTCCATIPKIKELGGTHGEPGHALTGTTPLHLFEDQPELPAILYVSEISHNYEDRSCFYGGGYYRRGGFDSALIYEGDTESDCKVYPFSHEHIDYYLETSRSYAVGSTVIGAFRTQIFTTRSDVAVVSGVQSGNPCIEGIFDSGGHRLNG